MLPKAMGKQAYYRQIDLPQPQAYDLASAVMAKATITPDAQEGFAAFLEKRHPTFTQVPPKSPVSQSLR